MLKVISYNVNGLHSPIKRKKILGQLKSFNCHIAFLQETHLSDIEHDKLKRSWAQQVFYSSHKSGRKRGVAILIHRQINFTPLTTYRDPHGRYIVVNGSVDGVLVSLINIYAPNEDEPNFIHTISNLVLQKCSGVLLLGGDFNCVLSPYLDKQPSSKKPCITNEQSSKTFNN